MDGPIVSLPRRIPGGMAFDLVLLGPFLIASLSSEDSLLPSVSTPARGPSRGAS
jgi:hypothetical protein